MVMAIRNFMFQQWTFDGISCFGLWSSTFCSHKDRRCWRPSFEASPCFFSKPLYMFLVGTKGGLLLGSVLGCASPLAVQPFDERLVSDLT
jgi:hypothetical protein